MSTPRHPSPDPGTPAAPTAPAGGPGIMPPTPGTVPVVLAGVRGPSDDAAACAPVQQLHDAATITATPAALSPAAPRPPLPPRTGPVTTTATTSSDVSGSDLVHHHHGGRASPSPRGSGGSAPGAFASALLPKHTLVRVTGNARTRASLVGQEGRVRRSVGLGGWHLLTVRDSFVRGEGRGGGVAGGRGCVWARADARTGGVCLRPTRPSHQY
jgi:hypothetical protein